MMMESRPRALSVSVLSGLKRIAREDLALPDPQVDRIAEDTSLTEGFQLDSLTEVVLLTELEARYGIVPDIDDLEELQRAETVGDLVRFIERRLAPSP